MIARIDDQIVLACEVLWRVNQMIEAHQKQRAGGRSECRRSRSQAVRQQLMKREVAALVDRKLLYDEFRRNVPAENLPRIEENLREPFEEHEMPELMKQLKVEQPARAGARAGAAGLVAGRCAAGVQRASHRQRMDSLEGEDQRRSQPGRDD